MVSSKIFTIIFQLGILSTLGQQITNDTSSIKNLLINNTQGVLYSDNLKQYVNIEEFQLQLSNLSSFIINLQEFPKLKKLILEENVIGDLQLNFSGCCQQLEEIRFSSNKFNGQVELFKQLGSLKSLNFIEWRYQDLPVLKDNVLVNPNIESLVIKSCHMTTIENNALKYMENLIYLDLSGNKIGWINKEVLAPLKKVTNINLDGNYFIMLTTEMFPPSLPNLMQLSINFNNIKLLNLEGIKKIAPKLELIYAAGYTHSEDIKSDGIRVLGPIRVNNFS